MKAVSLLYHDIVNEGKFDSSGFPGLSPANYKLEIDEFGRHLKAIATAIKGKPTINVLDFSGEVKKQSPFVLTFDDGGSSAYTHIADLLEDLGWYGHFLITVNYIGSPSFVSVDQIRTLRRRGHVIGTHSCSHPERMSHCSWQELIEEWGTSIKVLSNILGEQVSVASVPGGYYSKRVAEAASAVGIRVLFTSEPTTKCHYVDDCLVLGRYTITRGMSPEIAAGFASHRLSLRLKQLLLWNFKKVAKTLGGESYLKIRQLFFKRRILS